MTDYAATIKADEGLNLMPYQCTAGKLTIGFGRNIEDRGISIREAEYLLENDIRASEKQAATLVYDFSGLSDPRKIVLVSMVFQLGKSGTSKFKNMISAINAGDFETAADEMLNSKWARQTANRAGRLAEMMRG